MNVESGHEIGDRNFTTDLVSFEAEIFNPISAEAKLLNCSTLHHNFFMYT